MSFLFTFNESSIRNVESYFKQLQLPNFFKLHPSRKLIQKTQNNDHFKSAHSNQIPLISQPNIEREKEHETSQFLKSRDIIPDKASAFSLSFPNFEVYPAPKFERLRDFLNFCNGGSQRVLLPLPTGTQGDISLPAIYWIWTSSCES